MSILKIIGVQVAVVGTTTIAASATFTRIAAKHAAGQITSYVSNCQTVAVAAAATAVIVGATAASINMVANKLNKEERARKSK